jgi:hypothetical protein
VPDLTDALREATPEVQRQVFEAFEVEILYDKAERKIEISATVSEAVAGAFEKQKALPKEGSLVVLREVAGARFVSRYDRPKIREIVRQAAQDPRLITSTADRMGGGIRTRDPRRVMRSSPCRGAPRLVPGRATAPLMADPSSADCRLLNAVRGSMWPPPA